MDLNRLSKEELMALVRKKDSTINKLEEQLDWYQRQIKLQQKQMYGRKSEKLNDENQLSLFDEIEVESSALKIEPELEEITYQRKKRKGKKEKDLSAFPVVQKIYDIPEGSTCSTCDGELRKVSENIRKELVYYPARYEVIEHIQYVYACRNCETNNVKTTFEKGNMPPALLPKSIVSASLAGAIVHNKFGLSLPLYRQEVNFKQNGLNLSRQTISNWLLKLYDYYLKDIHMYMHKQILSMSYIGADETTVQVLKEQGIAVSTKSYMWVYKSGRSEAKQVVLYKYEANRGHAHAQHHLQGYRGVLQSDGYQAYDKVEKVIQAGCLAHARRKFSDVIASAPKGVDIKESFSKEILKDMNQLFHIEKSFGTKDYDRIKQIRQEKSKPVFDAMYEKIRNTSGNVIANKKLKEAITYCINQESKLCAYLEDGRIEISNNGLERAIRPFTIGRKNWVFCNTPHGANASSCYYSLMETAKLNHLNPQAYFTYLFTLLPTIDLKDDQQTEQIMPWSKDLPKELTMKKQS